MRITDGIFIDDRKLNSHVYVNACLLPDKTQQAHNTKVAEYIRQRKVCKAQKSENNQENVKIIERNRKIPNGP
jgi:hypothetical protein